MQMLILKKSYVTSIYYFITNACFIRTILFAERNLIWLRNFYVSFFHYVTFESYFVVLANLKEQLEGNRRPNTQIF
jgi:hypothetical protein